MAPLSQGVWTGQFYLLVPCHLVKAMNQERRTLIYIENRESSMNS